MVGGKGDDVYVVNSAADVVAEQANQGSDLVRSSAAYTLSANVENLTLTGSGSLNGTGNGLSNTLVGNAGINSLDGGLGNDSLDGGGGNDALTGSAGKDTLSGGAGKDVFKYGLAADSGITTSLRDSISDFNSLQGDKIDLSALDANAAVSGNQAFSLFSKGAAFAGSFTAQASLFFDQTAHVLYGNNDADAAADFSIGLVGVGSLAATDFVL